MKVFGSISRLVSLLFRKNSQDITVRPNQATTYTASRDVQLPVGDTDHVLISASSVATLTNKTFDADGTGNSITNIENADIKAGAAIDASKIADGSVSSAEFQFINSLTSNAQTQLDARVVGPASATDNALARFDGTTGKLVQNSTGILSDTGDLTLATVVATGALRSNTSLILEETGAGTDTITIQAPASIAASYTLTLPVDDGTPDQYLKTDGSGVLSWQTVSAFSAFEATWALGDGATKSITHNLGTRDVQVEIYDLTTFETILVDQVIRTDANTLDLSASEAPGAGGWRVTIHAS